MHPSILLCVSFARSIKCYELKLMRTYISYVLPHAIQEWLNIIYRTWRHELSVVRIPATVLPSSASIGHSGSCVDKWTITVNCAQFRPPLSCAVYWSNWAGLSDVTSALQVQRGLGSSKLTSSSAGSSSLCVPGTCRGRLKELDCRGGMKVRESRLPRGGRPFSAAWMTGLRAEMSKLRR